MVIYLITNKVNGKKYVGQTTRTPEARFTAHVSSKRQGYFQSALRKYGKHNFDIQVLSRHTNQKELNLAEKIWIRALQTWDSKFGYNSTFGGESFTIFAPAVIEKFSRSRKGKPRTTPISAEARAKLGAVAKARWDARKADPDSTRTIGKPVGPRSKPLVTLVGK